MAESFDRKSALAFIVAFGIVSLFADMAYEGMRSSTGPFLALLGASGSTCAIASCTSTAPITTRPNTRTASMQAMPRMPIVSAQFAPKSLMCG